MFDKHAQNDLVKQKVYDLCLHINPQYNFHFEAVYRVEQLLCALDLSLLWRGNDSRKCPFMLIQGALKSVSEVSSVLKEKQTCRTIVDDGARENVFEIHYSCAILEKRESEQGWYSYANPNHMPTLTLTP